MNWKALIVLCAGIGAIVWVYAGFITGVAAFYFGTGFFFVTMSPSRGLWADAMFFALWPIYIYLDWKGGLL